MREREREVEREGERGEGEREDERVRETEREKERREGESIEKEKHTVHSFHLNMLQKTRTHPQCGWIYPPSYAAPLFLGRRGLANYN